MNVFGCTVKLPVRKLAGDWLDQATGLSEAELEGIDALGFAEASKLNLSP